MPPRPWQAEVYAVLKSAGIRQIGYVPDAGHAHLIEAAHADPDMRAVVLTTEEEGIALAAGAWLGGQRAALLMQSSGVGNCINMLSLPVNCRMPFFTLVTMRGEWAEFNPWQVPMGTATPAVLTAAGVHVRRADRPEDVAEMVAASAALAFDSQVPVAVLLSQRLIGAKVFTQPGAGTPEPGTREPWTREAGTPGAGTPEARTPKPGTPGAGTPEAGRPGAGKPESGP